MPHNNIRGRSNEAKVRLSKEHADITTSDNGGGNVEYEEILDLSPPTDVEYVLRNDRLHLLLELKDSGDTELTDDAQLYWIGQDQLEEDETKLTRTYRYGEFANANQRNNDEKVYFEFVVGNFPIEFTESSHLKLVMKHGTAVTWSNSKIEFEVYRRSY